MMMAATTATARPSESWFATMAPVTATAIRASAKTASLTLSSSCWVPIIVFAPVERPFPLLLRSPARAGLRVGGSVQRDARTKPRIGVPIRTPRTCRKAQRGHPGGYVFRTEKMEREIQGRAIGRPWREVALFRRLLSFSATRGIAARCLSGGRIYPRGCRTAPRTR